MDGYDVLCIVLMIATLVTVAVIQSFYKQEKLKANLVVEECWNLCRQAVHHNQNQAYSAAVSLCNTGIRRMTETHKENAKKFEVFAWLHIIKSQAHSRMGLWYSSMREMQLANYFIDEAEDKTVHLLVVGDRAVLPGRDARIRALIIVLQNNLGPALHSETVTDARVTFPDASEPIDVPQKDDARVSSFKRKQRHWQKRKRRRK